MVKWILDENRESRQGLDDKELKEPIFSAVVAKGIDNLKIERSFRQATVTQGSHENFDEESNRVCRVIAMDVLSPLYSVTKLDYFKEAVRDVVLVHHLLYSKHRILHRDISPHNLMGRFYTSGCDKVKGVLIDFDLASLELDTLSPERHLGSRPRTGTRPYMARELLQPKLPVHLERFDWESFFYVVCWIASHYSNGIIVETESFYRWDENDDNSLRCFKVVLICGHKDLMHLFTEFYKPLVLLWMDDIQTMFNEADRAKRKFARAQEDNPGGNTFVFDQDTLGGHVTWERFLDILKR